MTDTRAIRQRLKATRLARAREQVQRTARRWEEARAEVADAYQAHQVALMVLEQMESEMEETT